MHSSTDLLVPWKGCTYLANNKILIECSEKLQTYLHLQLRLICVYLGLQIQV